jgi:hypothetical protein
MSIAVLIILIVGISIAMYFFLRPLQVLSKRQWLVSHGFIFAGLGFILGWLWLSRGQSQGATMLMGGIWTLFGGLCLVVTYALRRLKRSK